jgi:hypothetical protein
MALHPTVLEPRTATVADLGWIILFAAAVAVLLLALNAVFGVAGPGPILEMVPDPAGITIPF